MCTPTSAHRHRIATPQTPTIRCLSKWHHQRRTKPRRRVTAFAARGLPSSRARGAARWRCAAGRVAARVCARARGDRGVGGGCGAARTIAPCLRRRRVAFLQESASASGLTQCPFAPVLQVRRDRAARCWERRAVRHGRRRAHVRLAWGRGDHTVRGRQQQRGVIVGSAAILRTTAGGLWRAVCRHVRRSSL